MYISVAQKLPEIWLETSKNIFCHKPDFVKIDEFSLLKRKKCKNRKIDTFMFLAISLAIFELQRRTIPHFNPLNKSIWPLGNKFLSVVDRFWVKRQNMCVVFFIQTLYTYAIYKLEKKCRFLGPDLLNDTPRHHQTMLECFIQVFFWYSVSMGWHLLTDWAPEAKVSNQSSNFLYLLQLLWKMKKLA